MLHEQARLEDLGLKRPTVVPLAPENTCSQTPSTEEEFVDHLPNLTSQFRELQLEFCHFCQGWPHDGRHCLD